MGNDSYYFTWPDRVFAYECRGCGDCCKGLGIGLDAVGGQVDRLVDLYPDLTPYLRKRGTTWTAFNPRGRCWFLRDDGMCRVEADHGRDTKPAACRLFPFNRVFRYGDHTIVDYNSVICPVEAPAADVDEASVGLSGRVRHVDVVRDIEGIADPGVVGTRLPGSAPEADAFVARERAVAQACFDAAPAGDVAAAWASMSDDLSWEDACGRVSEALTVLGVGAFEPPDAASASTALWLAPSLRFNELFGPRRWADHGAIVARLPLMWLAWTHFVSVGSRLAGRSLTMREATSLWSEEMPLCYLAARWRDRAALEPGPVELPGAADPRGVVRAFGEACVRNRGGDRSLGDMLSGALEGCAPADRVALARLAEPVWRGLDWGPRPVGKVAPTRSKSGKGKKKRRRR